MFYYENSTYDDLFIPSHIDTLKSIIKNNLEIVNPITSEFTVCSSFSFYADYLKSSFSLPESTTINFFDTNTETTVVLLNSIKHTIKNLCLIKPFYDNVANILDFLNIPYSIEQAIYKDNEWSLPIDKLSSYDFVYVTIPLYGTSDYNITNLNEFYSTAHAKNITIINDCALFIAKSNIFKLIPFYENNFYMISPHKAIGSNSIKFSALISGTNNTKKLEQNQLMLYSNNSYSMQLALNSYTQDSFINDLVPQCLSFFRDNEIITKTILQSNNIEYTHTNLKGFYMACKYKNNWIRLCLANDTNYITKTLPIFLKELQAE